MLHQVIFWIVIIISLLRQTVVAFTSNNTTVPSLVPPVSNRGDDDDQGQIWDEHDKASSALTESDSADFLLFVSTLDGTLNAINKGTGQVVWTLKEVWL